MQPEDTRVWAQYKPVNVIHLSKIIMENKKKKTLETLIFKRITWEKN